jgi:hypothetical protein
MSPLRPNRNGRPSRRRHISRAVCEFLETRRLLTALVVNDTPDIDMITLGVTPAGGVRTIVNGKQTDYAPGQWDSVLVNSSKGDDTINVQATVVPTTVHYNDYVSINVGDDSGVQDVKALLNMNGVKGGPAADGIAQITIDDSGDTAARQVVMTTVGDQEQIDGVAPAQIQIGVVSHPVSPGGPGLLISQDMLSLTTGTGDDAVTINSLRGGLSTTIANANGNDAVNVGNGSLARIDSPITLFAYPGISKGQASLTVDDSKNANAAQFTFNALFPPGPGPMMTLDFQGAGLPQGRISWTAVGTPTATVNGGSGGNTFLVNNFVTFSATSGATLNLNTGAGDDTITINKSQAGAVINVDGQGGNDSIKTGPIGPFSADGVNGNLKFHGGAGSNSVIVQGPETTPFDIPSMPVNVTAGLISHWNFEFHYADIARLQLENGFYEINAGLGNIALALATEPSSISFESSTGAEVNAGQNLRSLDVSGGTLMLASGGNVAVNSASLNLGAGGKLDLTDNALQVHYGGNSAAINPFTSIRKEIFAHYIFTSAADAAHNLGYADSADGVVPGLDPQTVLVRYALLGDANLDRRVDFSDLVLVAQHYGDQSGNANWDQGDFTYDGRVNFDDLVALAQNYNGPTPTASGAIAQAAVKPATASHAHPVAAAKPKPRAAAGKRVTIG